MKRTNLYLDEEHTRLLCHRAIEEGRSLTDLVHEALNAYLAHRGLLATSGVIGPRRTIRRDEWRLRFEGAVARLRANIPPDLDGDAIEAEITAARAEVRHERAKRRIAGA